MENIENAVKVDEQISRELINTILVAFEKIQNEILDGKMYTVEFMINIYINVIGNIIITTLDSLFGDILDKEGKKRMMILFVDQINVMVGEYLTDTLIKKEMH